MKRILPILMLVILAIPASCEKETVLIIDQTALSFTDIGGSQTISLTANKPWTASSNQSWCKISPSAGEEAASSRITLTFDANTTYDSRNCSVTFTCAEKTATVNVSQSTNNGLLVSQTSYELTKSAQQINIQVQANVKFSVEIDNGCKDWVKYNSTKGLTTSTVILDIAENETYDNRDGMVTIKQDGGSLSSTVIIKQSQADGLIAEKKEYVVSSDSQVLDIHVRSNINYDVIIDETCKDWISRISTKGLVEDTLFFQITNNENDQRQAKIYLRSSTIEEEIVVIQEDGRFVEFDDVYFELFCLKYYDKNNDRRISFSEAAAVESISITSGSNIKSLNGIERFINLTSLVCERVHLKSLDISHNSALTFLNCGSTGLAELDVSHNTALNSLDCSDNRLTSLDISRNVALANLYCGDNRLASLDVSHNTTLKELWCYSNKLTSLDVSHNLALNTLACMDNQLQSLELCNNTALISLYCHVNQLTVLDVSNNLALSSLWCPNNPYLVEIWLKTNQTIKDFQYDKDVASIKYK